MWNALVQWVAPEPTEVEVLVGSLQQGRVDALEAWLGAGGDVVGLRVGEDAHMSLLHIASLHGNLPAVRVLVERLPVEDPTSGGNTALHLAAMRGHAEVVAFLAGERGGSVCAKNKAGQNVFDVAQGLQLRQTLMQMVLAEEQRNGTAPVIAGGSRDTSKDHERLRNLPPPPTSVGNNNSNRPLGGGGPPPIPPLPAAASRIQPDGFITTVGNPNLASKYGNQTQTRLTTAASGPPPMVTPPVVSAASSSSSLHAPPRYVVNAPGVTVSSSASTPSGLPRATNPPPRASNVTVFNPGAMMEAQQQQQQQQQQ